MFDYIIDRRFPGWNKSDECFRAARGEILHYDILLSFFTKGKITFTDLLAAYNQITCSSIMPKFQSYYVPAGTVVEDDTPAVTDDFEDVKNDVELNNPRWEHVDSARKNESADSVAPGDTITLMVDCLNLAHGASVEFTLYDTSGNKPRKVASVKGMLSGGLAKAEWLVDDSQCTPDSTYSFDAKAKGAVSTRCRIDMLPDSFTVRLHINPSSPESNDDTFILFTDDESQKITRTVKDDKVPGDAFLDLFFSGIRKDKKYSLVVDPGKEGARYFVFENVEGNVLLSDD
jgi:hypothetical protein